MQTHATFNQTFETMRYPAGESHVRIRASADPAALDVVEAMTWSFEDLGQVITANRILQRQGHAVDWVLPYFPFARHDRRNDASDGFELGLALEMVHELNPIVVDPHSDVAGQLRHFSQAEVVASFRRAGLLDPEAIVVIPDAGATKKAMTWIDGQTAVQALKTRDPTTGRLSGFAVLSEDLRGHPCVVIDDICDGGGTFLGLAELLRAKNAGALTLAVTHGLFTKGTDALAESFQTIASMAPADSPPVSGVSTVPFHDLYSKGTFT